MTLKQHLTSFPFVAITRGIKSTEAESLCEILFNSGFRVIETPMNSPEPCQSIKLMAKAYGDRALIGAGTVITIDQVEQVREAGGSLIVSPHCDPKIIKKTKELGLISIPGVTTPTEIMIAINAGADALKLFPAEVIQMSGFKALKSIIPPETLLIPVGGINTDNWLQYIQAGAIACGLGSSLYKAEMSSENLKHSCKMFKNSWEKNKANISSNF